MKTAVSGVTERITASKQALNKLIGRAGRGALSGCERSHEDPRRPVDDTLARAKRGPLEERVNLNNRPRCGLEYGALAGGAGSTL